MELAQLLRWYVDGIRGLAGACGAEYVLPAAGAPSHGPITIRVGPEAPDGVVQAARRAHLGDRAAATRTRIVPSPDGRTDTVLIRFAEGLGSADTERDTPRRRHDDHLDAARDACAWLALRFPAEGPDSTTPPVERLRALIGEASGATWQWMLELGDHLAAHAEQTVLTSRDPVTGLPLRTALLARLAELWSAADGSRGDWSLLLIHPAGFGRLNRRLGRERADRVLRALAERVRATIRETDAVFRYGGAVLAALVPGPEKASKAIATKLAEELATADVGAEAELEISIGYASLDAAAEPPADPFEIIHRADRALHAASERSPRRIASWTPSLEDGAARSFDRLSGIFTGDTTRDYRNMALLWRTLQALGARATPPELAARVTETFYDALPLERVLLLARAEGAELEVLHGLARAERPGQERVEVADIEERDRSLIREAGRNACALCERRDDDGRRRDTWAVPLASDDRQLGFLLLEGSHDELQLERSDARFLEAFGAQLAMALDRAVLAQRERRRVEAEQHRLRRELAELRDALGSVRMIYRSEPMDRLVELLHRVAPTDATVLITGASGTGKELVARTLHTLSTRKNGPWVVVDCGAIAASLIDSELFGHVRGAYTGAGSTRAGRLAEADGGTVLLDEIGELPLEVQSKLLRFVQERQLTAVGSSRPQRVDVRLIAATNRDLQEEVRAGRFREDLYYRLNVVHLEVPPLRQRPDDILLLAQHFLRSAAVQHQRDVRGFSAEAEQALLAHTWPGNVRELQNRVLKAVLLCTERAITPTDLGFDRLGPLGAAPQRGSPEPRADSAPQPQGDPFAAPASGAGRHVALQELRAQLAAVLPSLIEHPEPVRSVVQTELLHAADEESDGVLRRGAELLGLPESTYRRRLRQRADAGETSLDRTTLRRTLSALLASDGDADLWDAVERVVLEEIERVAGDRRGVATRLFDVSAPTYRRRVAELRAAAPRPATDRR